MRSLIAPPLIAALLFTGCGPLLPRTTIVPPATTGAEREVAFRDAARKSRRTGGCLEPHADEQATLTVIRQLRRSGYTLKRIAVS